MKRAKRMKLIREIAGVTVALTACAGPSAGGQIGPTTADPFARLYLYEVAPEQVTQARVIAEALGHELGQPLEVRGGAQRPVPMRTLSPMLTNAQAAQTPIETGDQSVTIRFALGPELGGR